MGDYGVGPNHVLPTGGTGRYTGGLRIATARSGGSVRHCPEPAARSRQPRVRDATASPRSSGVPTRIPATAGLSVFTFLAMRTWMHLEPSDVRGMKTVVDDAATIARMEGLEGHARAALLRSAARQQRQQTANARL